MYFVRVLVFFYFLCKFDLDSDLVSLGDRLQGGWDQYVDWADEAFYTPDEGDDSPDRGRD